MPTPQMHLAVLGLLFLIAAFYTFSCTLVLHAANRLRQASGPWQPARGNRQA
jgi:hypothetical protein